ncbi:MAG: hypothetical protein U9R05_11010 [Chloroflexota bacterium]|nr:hypothetical protein [Chloroflexota bacterium]
MAGFFPVRGWRGSPPRAAAGRGRRDVVRAGTVLVLGSPVHAPQPVVAGGASSARGLGNAIPESGRNRG